jgi:hypothetical protein
MGEAPQNTAHLLRKYGDSFFLKLPLYKTCRWQGRPVRLCGVDLRTLRADVQDVEGTLWRNVPVAELDNFVL